MKKILLLSLFSIVTLIPFPKQKTIRTKLKSFSVNKCNYKQKMTLSLDLNLGTTK